MRERFEGGKAHKAHATQARTWPVRSAAAVVVIGLILLLAYAIWWPPLPIATTFRPAIDGNSEVAQFHNTGDKYLVIQATFENAGLDRRRGIVLNIGPYQTLEFGWLEGWSFMSGERIVLASDGYRAQSIRVP
jgi:hypothetical protein